MPNDASIICGPAENAVLRLVTVEVTQGVDAFLAELGRGRTILRRCGVEGTIRAWLATYAGTDTGTIVLTFEFADMASFARSEAAFAAAPEDQEYQVWSKRLPELRRIISDSLYFELAPEPVVG